MTNLMILLIKMYQKIFGHYILQCCRFQPSCSEYSILVFTRFGFFKGLFLTINRILRCNPLGGKGLDPAPHQSFED